MDCRHQYVHSEWSGGDKISSEISHQWPFLLCISGPLPQPCCGSRLTHHSSFQPLKSQYLSNHSVLDLASCLTHLLLMPMNIHLSSPRSSSPVLAWFPYPVQNTWLALNIFSSTHPASSCHCPATICNGQNSKPGSLACPHSLPLLKLTHYLQRGSVEPAQNWGCSSSMSHRLMEALFMTVWDI